MNLRALLELMRVSNLPTVWSNVVMGMAWGVAVTRELAIRDGYIPLQDDAELRSVLSGACAMLFAGSMIYCGGMILNDAFDAEIDRRERPGRPIPSGRVTRLHAFSVGLAMLLGSLVFLMNYSSPWVLASGCALIALVLLYDALHAYSAFSVILMGLCRATLVFMAIMSVGGGSYWPTAMMLVAPAALFGYTLLISVVARHEVRHGRAWVVGAMIASMPLVDAGLLLAVGEWFVAPFCLMCAVMAWVGQRWIAGS